jgi:O-antigen/teichoic acid export membrane protein
LSADRKGVHKRLAAGFGVNILGKGTSTLIQVVSVPIFLKHWGVDLYGEWLVLNSIPSYFALSDVGFGSTAGNEMTMLMATNKQEEALDVFQSVLALTTGISVTIGAIFMALVWFLPFERWLHITSISRHDTNLVILMLALSVLLTMQETLLQAAFRCVARYVFGTLLKNIVQLTTFAGVSIVVLSGGGVVAAAKTIALLNACGTIMLWIMLRRSVPWIRYGVSHAHWATLRRLAAPAVSFMAFPVGNALNLQGMLLVVGHVLGPTAVVIFSTARTVSRVAIQFMEMVKNTIWPEMSIAVGAGDFALARSLHRRACQVSIFAATAIVLVMAVIGPAIWQRWTMHKFATDPVLLDLMLLLVLFSSLWSTSSVTLSATNRHQRLAMVYLTATSISLVCAYVLAGIFGLHGVAVALMAGEIFMAAHVLRASLAFLGDTFSGFFGSMLSIPRIPRLRRT